MSIILHESTLFLFSTCVPYHSQFVYRVSCSAFFCNTIPYPIRNHNILQKKTFSLLCRVFRPKLGASSNLWIAISMLKLPQAKPNAQFNRLSMLLRLHVIIIKYMNALPIGRQKNYVGIQQPDIIRKISGRKEEVFTRESQRKYFDQHSLASDCLPLLTACHVSSRNILLQAISFPFVFMFSNSHPLRNRGMHRFNTVRNHSLRA